MDNYEKIINENLKLLYDNFPENLDQLLPGQQEEQRIILNAFGESCCIGPDGITIGDDPVSGVIGILITLYALHANADQCTPTPYKAFREFPNSMPYVGAFASHTERILIPHIDLIENNIDLVFERLHGEFGIAAESGDFSIVVRPLPKIKLKYIFYRADEEFPASATCLFSNNALSFLPIDGLADTGEYTSKKIIEIVS